MLTSTDIINKIFHLEFFFHGWQGNAKDSNEIKQGKAEI